MVPELEEYSLYMPVKICPDEQLTFATVESESHKVAAQQCIYTYLILLKPIDNDHHTVQSWIPFFQNNA